jgi:hypothetical protein
VLSIATVSSGLSERYLFSNQFRLLETKLVLQRPGDAVVRLIIFNHQEWLDNHGPKPTLGLLSRQVTAPSSRTIVDVVGYLRAASLILATADSHDRRQRLLQPSEELVKSAARWPIECLRSGEEIGMLQDMETAFKSTTFLSKIISEAERILFKIGPLMPLFESIDIASTYLGGYMLFVAAVLQYFSIEAKRPLSIRKLATKFFISKSQVANVLRLFSERGWFKFERGGDLHFASTKAIRRI